MQDRDVIGNALLDYYRGIYADDIVVISSIAEDDIIPIPYLFRSEEELPPIEKKALKLCKGKVLDVGAGSGCHSLILQHNNFNVEAIDVSKGAVNVMIQRGLTAQKLNFFEVTQKYDTLLFLMNGIGIAATLKELPTFLKKARTLLNDKGQILLDSSDISYMYREEDGSIWVDLNSSYPGEVNYQMQYKNITGDTFSWLFIDFETLKEIAAKEGLTCELMMEGDHYNYLARLTASS